MAQTSGTYTFSETNSDQFILEAYERTGKTRDIILAGDIQTAQRSINLFLSQLINRGLNQWSLTLSSLGFNPGQSVYQLPTNTSDILEMVIRTSSRQLGGTPASTPGGTAIYAFDGNPLTACTQSGPNGNISYDYGSGARVNIPMVGIQSNATITYTLVVEISFDNATWINALTIPAQSYPIGQIQWFMITVPIAARAYRIRETGGATLDIQELYFNNNLQDIPLSRMSAQEYVDLPQKLQSGRPSQFWLNKQVQPLLYVWPVPNAQYNNVFYSRTRMLQDVGKMTDTVEIPQRFFEPLCADLAYRLAVKIKDFPMEKLLLLKSEAEKSFNQASAEDADTTPIRLYGNFESSWSPV